MVSHRNLCHHEEALPSMEPPLHVSSLLWRKVLQKMVIWRPKMFFGEPKMFVLWHCCENQFFRTLIFKSALFALWVFTPKTHSMWMFTESVFGEPQIISPMASLKKGFWTFIFKHVGWWECCWSPGLTIKSDWLIGMLSQYNVPSSHCECPALRMNPHVQR